MSPELQAMRQRFMEQAPGLAIFDELAAKYDRLLMDLSHLDRRWKTALPDQVRALRVALQEIAGREIGRASCRERV